MPLSGPRETGPGESCGPSSPAESPLGLSFRPSVHPAQVFSLSPQESSRQVNTHTHARTHTHTHTRAHVSAGRAGRPEEWSRRAGWEADTHWLSGTFSESRGWTYRQTPGERVLEKGEWVRRPQGPGRSVWSFHQVRWKTQGTLALRAHWGCRSRQCGMGAEPVRGLPRVTGAMERRRGCKVQSDPVVFWRPRERTVVWKAPGGGA